MGVPLGYTVEVLRTIEQIEKRRPFWEALQDHPNNDIDIYLNLVKAKEKQVSPYVVLVLTHDEASAMMIGFIKKREIAYKMFRGPELRILTIQERGILGHQTEENADIFRSQLATALAKRDADAVELREMDINTCLLRFSQKKPNRFFVVRSNPGLHWRTTLPETIGELYQSLGAKQKHELFRKERQAKKRAKGRIAYRCFRNNNMSELYHYIEGIAQKSFQRSVGCGFKDCDEHHRFLMLAASRGWLRVHVLSINEEPCAFLIALLYKKVLHFYWAGHDLSWRKCNPGNVLLKHVLEQLYSEPEVQAIDWGPGDSNLTRHFGNHATQESSMFMFPRSALGFVSYLRTATFIRKVELTKTILVKMNLRDKAVCHWRHKVIAGHVRAMAQKKVRITSQVETSAAKYVG